MSSEFKREERYIVFKVSDLGNSLKGDEIRKLAREYAEHRKQRGKEPLECVVVEKDWPEYETTWKAIEARVTGAQAQPAPKAVAYLDLGVGGYMDIGTDLTDEELATLPKGRHMLGIIGTYGVDGYAPAQPAPSFADAYQGAMEEVAIWKKRALEAEDLNRRFVAEINGHTHMGEPVQPAPSVPNPFRDLIEEIVKEADDYEKRTGDAITGWIPKARAALLKAAPESKP